jgi:hypothetical protein
VGRARFTAGRGRLPGAFSGIGKNRALIGDLQRCGSRAEEYPEISQSGADVTQMEDSMNDLILLAGGVVLLIGVAIIFARRPTV